MLVTTHEKKLGQQTTLCAAVSTDVTQHEGLAQQANFREAVSSTDPRKERREQENTDLLLKVRSAQPSITPSTDSVDGPPKGRPVVHSPITTSGLNDRAQDERLEQQTTSPPDSGVMPSKVRSVTLSTNPAHALAGVPLNVQLDQ